jgi:DNA-binding NarL/FixJ family response regulator
MPGALFTKLGCVGGWTHRSRRNLIDGRAHRSKRSHPWRRPDYSSAVDLLAADGEVEVVITDISMPGPRDGNDLIRAIRSQYPSRVVVAATGTSIHGLVDGVLRKPYDPAAAAKLVRGLLIKKALGRKAERHVAEDEEHVLRQFALVEQLAVAGHDTADARSMLTEFAELLALDIAIVDRLRRGVSNDH